MNIFTKVEKTVFICYRRNDISLAKTVYQTLTTDGYNCFMYIDVIEDKSVARMILNQIVARAHFVLILTPSTLERITEPNNWGRREIETALEQKRNIIPLMFDGFGFVDAQKYLVGKLAVLPKYKRLDVQSSNIEEAMERLKTQFLTKRVNVTLRSTPVGERQLVIDTKAKMGQKFATIDEKVAADKQAIVNKQLAKEWFERGLKHDRKDLEGRIADFTQSIRLNPQNDLAFYWRAVAFKYNEKFDEACADFIEAIRLNPNGTNPDGRISYHNIFSGIYIERGESRKDDLDGAIADYTEAIRICPQNVMGYYCRGHALRKKGDLDGAIADFSQVIRLDAENNAGSGRGYEFRGNARKAKGDIKGANADATEGEIVRSSYEIERHPRKADNYIWRGNARQRKGDLDGALADFNMALRLKPKNIGIYLNRGNIYQEKGDFDGAIIEYNIAIHLDPQFADAYNNRGNAIKSKGDLNGAITDYNTAIHFNPEDASAYNNRGTVHYANGDLDKAIADYNVAIQLNPHFTMVYTNRGAALKAKGDMVGAIADFSEIIRLNPQNAQAYNYRGIIREENGELQGAIADFSEAIRLNPQYAEAYTNREDAQNKAAENAYYDKLASKSGF